MNRWLALSVVAAGVAAFFAVPIGAFAWLARRHERRHGIGPDDGGRYTGGSDLDHLALDQAADDAHG